MTEFSCQIRLTTGLRCGTAIVENYPETTSEGKKDENVGALTGKHIKIASLLAVLVRARLKESGKK